MSAAAKHTPGPWYAVASWVEHEDDDVADICTCDPAAIGQEHLGRSTDEIYANVRLIAAAPELLASLQALINEYEPNRKVFAYNAPRKEMWERAVAAIAKATGGAA